jgi:diguanylate cyclase (GGDEF)-like protein
MALIGTARMTGEDHRWPILRALLACTALGGTAYTIVNFSRGDVAIALVELVMTVYAVVLLLTAKPGRYLDRVILAYLLPFFCAMLIIFVLASDRAGDTVFIWVLLIPILSHLLLGRWRGLAASVVFLAAAGLIYFHRVSSVGKAIDAVDVINIGLASSVIVLFSNIYERSRERIEHSLIRQATTDLLTELANRRGFFQTARREHARCRRHRQPLSLLLLDLDHFKTVNDRYGHDAGDAVLKNVAQLLRSRLRASDLVGRFGGEEFIILLPQTRLNEAAELAEELRQAVAESATVFEAQEIPMAVSIGVVEAEEESLDALISRADDRLYASKRSGRNRVTAHS